VTTYSNGTVTSVTTPLDGSPSIVQMEVDNPNYDPDALPEPGPPPEEPRIGKQFQIEDEKTIDRLIDRAGEPEKQTDVTTDSAGAVTHVTYR